MAENVIGRDDEKALLMNIMKSGEAELVVIYGRRRVGKTYLIRNFLRQYIAFEVSGMHNVTLSQQLENFSDALVKAGAKLKGSRPDDWSKAFDMLVRFLLPVLKKQRKVIFIDEFPWFHTPKSGFMPAFEHFWNTWASLQKNLVVIICGSSAAWMIQKVINNRGGLHNRVTRRIRLLPFNLYETEAFLRSRMVNLDRYQVLQLYMVMGGVPQYLKEVRKGESAIQAIDRTCFTKDGLLHDEFRNLFLSLFDDATHHIAVIRALAKKNIGLTRSQIIENIGLATGGGLTQVLEELTESGFITPYIPFGKVAKDGIYKLTDEYSLFYTKFIEGSRFTGAGTWQKFSTKTSWRSWSGVAFESICMKHILQLKRALGVEGVHTETSAWRFQSKGEDGGIQIDLLIDRQDLCINVCEMKFSVGPFELTKAYVRELENKVNVFRSRTKTRKTLLLTVITTHGIKNADSFPGRIQNEITMEALFR